MTRPSYSAWRTWSPDWVLWFLEPMLNGVKLSLTRAHVFEEPDGPRVVGMRRIDPDPGRHLAVRAIVASRRKRNAKFQRLVDQDHGILNTGHAGPHEIAAAGFIKDFPAVFLKAQNRC